MKEIATSGLTFKRIIENNCLYVDKTESLFSLISRSDIYFFLSRPRRFGKSLTLSTLESIFNGEKQLFSSLYIGTKTKYTFPIHPVVRFDFSKIQHKNASELERAITEAIEAEAKRKNITLKAELYASKLDELLFTLNKRDGSVVVLIDEYDAPLSDNSLKSDKVIEEINNILKTFYSTLKSDTEFLRFVFITGVTKFAKLGLFSTMNNLIDISMSPEYATMLGYSEEELRSNFSEYIEEGIYLSNTPLYEYLEKVKEHYNGFSFVDGKSTVYNPVSIGKFFSEGKGVNFDNYWFNTGTPELLMKMANKLDFSIIRDMKEPVDFRILENLDITKIVKNPTPTNLKYLMLQSGYLSISSKTTDKRYILKYPNEEVEQSFSLALVNAYTKEENLAQTISNTISVSIREGNFEKAIEEINSAFSSISFRALPLEATEAQYKGFLQILFNASCCYALDERVIAENELSGGKPDLIVETKEHVYVIETKLDQKATTAIQQIKDNGYASQYKTKTEKRKIHLIGISFSSAKAQLKKDRRKISSWIKEII